MARYVVDRAASVLLLLPLWVNAQTLSDAVSAFERGDMGAAERSVRSTLRVHPNEPSALSLLAAVLDEEKRYQEADDVYRRAIARGEPSAVLLNNYGNHLLETGNLDSAHSVFLNVLQLAPEHPNANLQLARIEVNRKDFRAAAAHLTRIPAQMQTDFGVGLLKLQALYGTKQDAAADSLLAQLATDSQSKEQVSFSLGLALANVGKYDKAEQFFAQTLELAPSNFDVLYNLGIAASRASDKERAREVLVAALKQRPNDVDVLYNLGVVYAELNQKDLAVAVLAQAARISPNRADVQLLLAHVTSDLGYDIDALEAWDRYLRLKPDDDVARRERALTLAVLGRYEDSIPELKKYVERHPTDPIGYYEFGLAETLVDPKNALVQFDRALALKPDLVAALADRGLLNYRDNDLPSALRDLEAANKMLPNDATIWDRLGEVYLALHRTGDAVVVLRKAAEATPNDAKVLLHYGRALAGAGQADEASKVMARFRELGPAHTQRRGGLVAFLSLRPDERYADFRSRIEKAAAENPADMAVQVQYLKILLSAGDADRAKLTAERIEASGAKASLLADAGRALLESDKYLLAKQVLEKADLAGGAPGVKLDLAIISFQIDGATAGLKQLDAATGPERNGDYYLARAEMLDAAGRFPEAVTAINQALREAPKRPNLYREVTFFLLKNGRVAEAIDLLNQATRILPDNPEILLLKATTLELARKTEDAERLLEQIENRWPEWYSVWLTHGIILETYKRYDEARQMIETAVALGAGTPEAYFYLAESTLYSAPEKIDAAQAAIGKAVDLAPQDPWARALAGRIAFEKKDYAAAVQQLQEAIKWAPHLVQAHYTLAQAYKALGNETQAQAELKEVALIHKDFPNAGNEVGDLRERLFEVRAPQN